MLDEISAVVKENSSLISRLERDERTLGEDEIFHGTVVSSEDSEDLRKKYREAQEKYREVAKVLEKIDAIYRKYIGNQTSTR